MLPYEDSASKRLIRFRIWDQIVLHRPAPQYVCLAGRGGDIQCLRAMGIPPSRIVAIDTDADAIQFCMQQFPGITCLHGDVGGYQPLPDAAVWLDFCAPINRETVTTMQRMARQCLSGTLVVSFLKGRDMRMTGSAEVWNAPYCPDRRDSDDTPRRGPRGGAWAEEDARRAAFARNRMNAALALCGPGLLRPLVYESSTGRPFIPTHLWTDIVHKAFAMSDVDLFEVMRSLYPDTPVGVLRLAVVCELLRSGWGAGRGLPYAWHPWIGAEYKGTSPMLTIGLRPEAQMRAPPARSPSAFNPQTVDIGRTHGPYDGRPGYSLDIPTDDYGRDAFPWLTVKEADAAAVVRLLAARNASCADALGIPAAQAAAWRAVATRSLKTADPAESAL